jgi:hypothetical protein
MFPPPPNASDWEGNTGVSALQRSAAGSIGNSALFERAVLVLTSDCTRPVAVRLQ